VLVPMGSGPRFLLPRAFVVAGAHP
jgi:hypothetical protein